MLRLRYGQQTFTVAQRSLTTNNPCCTLCCCLSWYNSWPVWGHNTVQCLRTGSVCAYTYAAVCVCVLCAQANNGGKKKDEGKAQTQKDKLDAKADTQQVTVEPQTQQGNTGGHCARTLLTNSQRSKHMNSHKQRGHPYGSETARRVHDGSESGVLFVCVGWPATGGCSGCRHTDRD